MTEEINACLQVLRKGGILLYPTDTVWGLGCDATNPEAVARIYEIKKRSDTKSLVLLASDMDMVARYVKEIPEMAIQLVAVNDAPMTIIYPDAIAGDAPTESRPAVADRHCLAYNAVAEDGTVGIRVPMMDFCLRLVHGFGRPIVSTSANISGEATPRKFDEISSEIISSADHVVDRAFEKDATGKASSIIKLGLDYSVEIIRK
ncbi:MAG: threonylcarbamoyl-AMP synthase [Bacteroidales bacterium]|nr:threonylcarbamoyl-AMP synthase [Bacteroidales bacterium]